MSVLRKIVDGLSRTMRPEGGFSDLDFAIGCLCVISEGGEPAAASAANLAIEILRERRLKRGMS